MVDIHSHIIYGIDDGSSSIEETIEILKKMKELGFDNMVLTPHYINGSSYVSNNKKKEERLKVIKEILNKNKININLFLGNEIYITDNIDKLLLNGEVSSINNSKYLLIELPLYNEVKGALDFLYELKVSGYVPIIAHPERYLYFQKDHNKLDELYASGVLFQCNYGSIVGSYGVKAKKLIKYMLKKNMVTFMASYVHKKISSLFDNFDIIIKKIKKVTKDDIFEKITNDNALKIINNKDID